MKQRNASSRISLTFLTCFVKKCGANRKRAQYSHGYYAMLFLLMIPMHGIGVQFSDLDRDFVHLKQAGRGKWNIILPYRFSSAALPAIG
jgi:hypothetical protein